MTLQTSCVLARVCDSTGASRPSTRRHKTKFSEKGGRRATGTAEQDRLKAATVQRKKVGLRAEQRLSANRWYGSCREQKPGLDPSGRDRLRYCPEDDSSHRCDTRTRLDSVALWQSSDRSTRASPAESTASAPAPSQPAPPPSTAPPSQVAKVKSYVELSALEASAGRNSGLAR